MNNSSDKHAPSGARYARASEVPVCTFHEILFWPFVLAEDETDAPEDMAGRMAQIANAIAGEEGWQPVHDLALYLDEDEPAQRGKNTWAEIVYFHDFVQRALFRKFKQWPDESAPIHLLRNNSLKGIRVRTKERELRFSVKRFHLYLFSSGAATLVLEVALEQGHEPPVMLSDIQNFMDFFRRWHVPYWEDEKTPGLMADEVTWIWADGREDTFNLKSLSLNESLKHLLESETRAPLPLEHWQKLLPHTIRDHLAAVPKDKRQQRKPAAMRGLHWRAISDERMLTANFIRIPTPCYDRLKRSEWVRLCFADAAGDEWPYLIHDQDWETFRKEHIFDWFHHWRTRQLFAGFNYTIASDSNFALTHFRRHYFQMALLAHFEYATLLSYSSRITRAVEALRGNGGEAAFRERFIRIRRDFLRFVHEFRFTGVSNQMQGIALHDLWRKHLGLHALYHDVEDELRSGGDYLLAIENREQTDAANRLSIIVAVATVLGLVTAFSGTTGMEIMWQRFGKNNWFSIYGAMMVVSLALSFTIAKYVVKNDRKYNELLSMAKKVLNILIPLFAFIFIAGFIF